MGPQAQDRERAKAKEEQLDIITGHCGLWIPALVQGRDGDQRLSLCGTVTFTKTEPKTGSPSASHAHTGWS